MGELQGWTRAHLAPVVLGHGIRAVPKLVFVEVKGEIEDGLGNKPA